MKRLRKIYKYNHIYVYINPIPLHEQDATQGQWFEWLLFDTNNSI